MKIESLEPLENVENLKKLSFSAKKIENSDVSPLARIKKLEEIEFPTNLFSTDKVAWLKARLNERVKSNVLAPFKEIRKPLKEKDKILDTLVIGKRKPFLDSNIDAARLEKYVGKFNSLVEYYLNNPNEPEPK